MKRFAFAALALAILLAGCATIISGTKQDVSINSNPDGADIQIKTGGGLTVFSGSTPANCKLPRNKEYTVVVRMVGYKDQELYINREFNAWFVGNLLCGGIVGIVIDAVDGAMWNLDPDMIHVELVKTLADGRINTYAVIGAIDDQGQLRTIAIPMIPVKG